MSFLKIIIRRKTQYPAPLMKTEFWGPRKTWVKETPLPANLEEQPTVWGEEKVAVWNRKKNEIEIRKKVYSPLKEKIELIKGRLRRSRLNKFVLENRFEKTLMRQQWEGYQANFALHPTKYAEFSQIYGARWVSAFMLTDRMDCAILYRDSFTDQLEWLEESRKMKGDPLELEVFGIDGRMSMLGYYGLDQLRLFKTCRYLNLANNLNIDDHCLTKLHWIDESLEYLDLSGTNVTLKGLGYLRILQNLKWLNLSNLDNQPDIENYAAFISEVLPPDCQVIYSEDDDLGVDLLPSGEETSILSSKDVIEMFKLPPPGKMAWSGLINGYLRRRKLIENYNRKRDTKYLKDTVYAKAAERLPPLI